MKIKYRIALLFTSVVMTILLLVCFSVYYLSFLNRENDFRKRLRNRALTTVSLLIKVQEIDTVLLKKIDASTVISLQEKSVIIYDSSSNQLYRYRDPNANAVTAPKDILDRAREKGEYFFGEGRKDAIAVYFTHGGTGYFVVAAAYDEDGLTKLSHLKLVLVICFLSGSLITLLSSLFFSMKIVKPIQQITNEVKIISSQNLSRRMKLQEPKDELHELTATFNELLNRLQQSFEIQRRFIANASHELSTPLTSISSQLEVALQQTRNEDEYREVMQSVYEDVANLTQLTRSLLELAKASGTPDGLELSLVRVDELLMKLPASLKKIDDKYRVELSFDNFPYNDDMLLAFGNSDLLFSAIKNIVHNACKYSKDNAALVNLKFYADQMDIIIMDNGEGISDAEKKHVFQPFYRTSNSHNATGFGLGLSLADRIVKLHKGKITLADNKAVGTIFTVTLPYGRNFHSLKND
jgi:two-component system sensor histidine kinase ArlS